MSGFDVNKCEYIMISVRLAMISVRSAMISVRWAMISVRWAVRLSSCLVGRGTYLMDAS